MTKEERIRRNKRVLENQILAALKRFGSTHDHSDYARWVSAQYREKYLGEPGVQTGVSRVLYSVTTKQYYVEIDVKIVGEQLDLEFGEEEVCSEPSIQYYGCD